MHQSGACAPRGVGAAARSACGRLRDELFAAGAGRYWVLNRFCGFGDGWFATAMDPSRTQLRNPADELHRNRFGEWEMDRPLSQLIAPELIFERRKERPRCGKQR